MTPINCRRGYVVLFLDAGVANASQSFFNEYRIAISHLGFAFKQEAPMWKDAEDWRQNRSTKWKIITELIQALLRNDKGPFPEMKDGELFIPDVELDLNARGKVVVYVEFTKTLDHLIQVCVFRCVAALY